MHWALSPKKASYTSYGAPIGAQTLKRRCNFAQYLTFPQNDCENICFFTYLIVLIYSLYSLAFAIKQFDFYNILFVIYISSKQRLLHTYEQKTNYKGQSGASLLVVRSIFYAYIDIFRWHFMLRF